MLSRMLIVCLFFLAGCAQQLQQPQPLQQGPLEPTLQRPKHQKPAPKAWQQHQDELASFNHWQAEGRLAASNAKKGVNASFVWVQKGDFYQIKLFGPFGSKSVLITGYPHFVELRQANGKVTRAKSAESLLKKVAGFQVPVNGLRYWLRGLPAPNALHHIQDFNHDGYLKEFIQQGWNIEYENYHDEQVPFLPNKLRLQHGNIKLKFVVTRWKNL